MTIYLGLHRWFPNVVRIALLGYGTLYAKIGFGMGKITLEFCTICNKVFYLLGTKAYMSFMSFDMRTKSFGMCIWDHMHGEYG